MKRTNWVKNKKEERFYIGQRWVVLPEYKKHLLLEGKIIEIIEISKITKGFCEVFNVINHSEKTTISKQDILSKYTIVEKKPIKKSNGKVRTIDLTQS